MIFLCVKFPITCTYPCISGFKHLNKSLSLGLCVVLCAKVVPLVSTEVFVCMYTIYQFMLDYFTLKAIQSKYRQCINKINMHICFFFCQIRVYQWIDPHKSVTERFDIGFRVGFRFGFRFMAQLSSKYLGSKAHFQLCLSFKPIQNFFC